MINEFWTNILFICGTIAAIAKFYLDWLQIKKAEIEIRELKNEAIHRKELIQIPTKIEIEKYGNSRWRRTSNILSSIFLIFMIGSIFLYRASTNIYRNDIEYLVKELNTELNTNAMTVATVNQHIVKPIGTPESTTYWNQLDGEELQNKLEALLSQYILFAGEFIVDRISSLEKNTFVVEGHVMQNSESVQLTLELIEGKENNWLVVSKISHITMPVFIPKIILQEP